MKAIRRTALGTTRAIASASQSGVGDSPELLEPPARYSREELLAQVRAFPFWYQRIYLGQGIYTMDNNGAPAYHEHVWRRLEPTLPTNLNNASVLDVGCNAGYFAIQSKLRGAGRVVGIEFIEEFVRQAELCRQVWNLEIEYRQLGADQVSSLNEQFDLVIFTGILYHLKNPLQALEDAGKICRDAIMVETEVISEDPRNTVYVRHGPYGKAGVTARHNGFMKFIEKDELNGDGSNWWVPDTECVRAMLRTAGFKYFSDPVYMTESRLVLVASKKSDSILNLRALK